MISDRDSNDWYNVKSLAYEISELSKGTTLSESLNEGRNVLFRVRPRQCQDDRFVRVRQESHHLTNQKMKI